jgi:gamma-glutamylcyclotransferase (GGCT)/AIG2-like uncharacterized protein YtfP
MRLFVYGTLCDARLRRRLAGRALAVQPAELPGWRRVRLRFTPYPTLRRARARVAGLLLQADAVTLRRFAAYEGARYRLRPVRVRRDGRTVAALAWIGDAPVPRHWP